VFVVDASVWVARFNDNDRFHRTSREWITSMMIGSVRLVEPVILFAEVSGALSRMMNDRDAADRSMAALISMPAMSLLPVDASLARQAARIASELRIRGVDAIYVALAEREEMDLVSWDSDHLSRASQRVTVHRPDELLSSQHRGDA
jgi:predicted nucleic acid-binding protein